MSTHPDLDQAIAEMVFLGSESKIPLSRLAGTTQASPKETVQALRRLSKLGYPLSLSRADMIERLSLRPIDVQRLRADLAVERIGQRIEWRLHVHSTQEELKRINSETEDGTVQLAETQDSGRGRLKRSWFSPLGGIWMSVMLRPTWPKSHQLLTLAFAAAVTKAISAVTGISALVKWPNDVIVRSRKAAGILAEASYEGSKLNHLIFGLGVNANVNATIFPRALRKSVTSLSHELGRDIDRYLLTRRILEEMDRRYCKFESGRVTELLGETRQVCSSLGRRVRVTTAEAGFEGEALDLGDDGQLIVRLTTGATVAFHAADIVHLR